MSATVANQSLTFNAQTSMLSVSVFVNSTDANAGITLVPVSNGSALKFGGGVGALDAQIQWTFGGPARLQADYRERQQHTSHCFGWIEHSKTMVPLFRGAAAGGVEYLMFGADVSGAGQFGFNVVQNNGTLKPFVMYMASTEVARLDVTNTTHPYFRLQQFAGTPTGNPGAGSVAYGTTNHRICVYEGGWKAVVVS